MITTRTYVITLLIAALIVGGIIWYYKSRQNEDIDLSKYVLKEQMQKEMAQRDSIIQSRNNELNTLIDENKKTRAEAAKWYKVAQERSKSPNYDIDFITATDIITNSRYKPTE